MIVFTQRGTANKNAVFMSPQNSRIRTVAESLENADQQFFDTTLHSFSAKGTKNLENIIVPKSNFSQVTIPKVVWDEISCILSLNCNVAGALEAFSVSRAQSAVAFGVLKAVDVFQFRKFVASVVSIDSTTKRYYSNVSRRLTIEWCLHRHWA